MTTTGMLSLAAALLAGAAAGSLFFGGLWWTIVRQIEARAAGLSFLVSYLLRTMAVLALLALATRWKPDLMVGWLISFTAARMLILRIMGPERAAAPAASAGAGRRDAH